MDEPVTGRTDLRQTDPFASDPCSSVFIRVGLCFPFPHGDTSPTEPARPVETTPMDDLWPPLRLSLVIATAATALVAAVGVATAYAAARSRWAVRTAVDAAMTLPLVLPPTVVGYLLIVLLGRHGWVGGPLARWTARLTPGGYSVLFRPEGGVLAAAVVSLPLLYLPARAAFAAVDPDLIDAARLSGAAGPRLFWHVSLPLARRGIAAGLLLAFARAVGEFGATDMVMGNLDGRQTLPIAIYNQTLNGDLHQAAPAVWTLTALALAIVLLYNRLPQADR